MDYMKNKNTNIKTVLPFFLIIVVFVFALSFAIPKFYNAPVVVEEVVEVEPEVVEVEPEVVEVEVADETEVESAEIDTADETEKKTIFGKIFGKKN